MIDSFTRQNVIGRLRVAGTNVDALSARLRATMLLNAANLEAAQPTPSSIVFIRKLRDPLPGVLSLDSSAIEPPMEWKTALVGALRSVTGRAGRPAIEAVNGNEEAIIFADRGELLACLAADLCHGNTATRWWWSYLLKAGHDLPAIVKIWRDSPEYVPAALQHLSKRHGVVAFVRKLHDDTAHQLVYAITHVFGLQWLMPAVRVRMAAIGPSDVGSRQASAIARSEELSSTPPWVEQAGEAAVHELSVEQQRFLGIALMIQRAPAVVHSRGFARAVEEWQEQVAGREANQVVASNSGPRVATSVTVGATAGSSDVHQTGDTAFRDEEVAEPSIQTSEQTVVKTLTSLSASVAEESISAEVIEGRLPEPAHFDNIGLSEPIEPNVTSSVTSTTEASTDPSTLEHREFNDDASLLFETELGGLFYLINLGLYLNLYADFTSPLASGIELNIWDFVALVGGELLEGEDIGDPIWTALANLAGRGETEPPGASFDPDGRWLSSFMPGVRARLREALGLETDDEIPAVLCRHHASVRATDTHVDVYFRLAELPLAIRFAGLDRDPGWVPAAGRFISFHFD